MYVLQSNVYFLISAMRCCCVHCLNRIYVKFFSFHNPECMQFSIMACHVIYAHITYSALKAIVILSQKFHFQYSLAFGART